ncbi:transposase, partial [Staphylococcus pseudintermedius]|uniref:transposase n=4 Tax=Bacteria TaxID=2 RepID=UPI001F5BDD90
RLSSEIMLVWSERPPRGAKRGRSSAASDVYKGQLCNRTPKKNSKSFREAVKGIFKFTDINLAREAKNRLIHDYIDQPKYSKACASLDDGFEDAFQYTVQGNSHNRLKSTNLIERLNQEVRRREKIIRIFPNQTSANRLIGAVLMDLHDEWIYSSRKYINFDK